jgi:hypothetical protein
MLIAMQGGLDPNKMSGAGTIFGLLVHVFPGPNKQRAPKSSMLLRIKVLTLIENNGDEQQHLCAALCFRSFLAALSAAVQHHERHVKPTRSLAEAAFNPRQASSKEGRQSNDFLYSLWHTLPSSPMASFSLLWRGISRLYETRTAPGRVLNSRVFHQGQPRKIRGLCLALIGALELLSAADWNILIFTLNLGLKYCKVCTRLSFYKVVLF